MLNLHPTFCNCIIHDKEEKINSLFNEIFMNIALFFRHIVKIRFCVRLRDNRTHRYKSPAGIFDIRPGRSICAAHSICPAGREGIYIISNVVRHISILPSGKNIELRSNISTFFDLIIWLMAERWGQRSLRKLFVKPKLVSLYI